MITSIIVSYDDQTNNEPIMIVGNKRTNQSIELINAFQGDEAVELYKGLTTQKSKEDVEIRMEGVSQWRLKKDHS